MQFYEEEKYLFEGKSYHIIKIYKSMKFISKLIIKQENKIIHEEIFNKEKSKLKINFERKNELFKKGRLLK